MINLFCIRPRGFNIGNDAIFISMQYFIQSAFGEVVNLISLPATSRYESVTKAGLTSKTIHEINQFGHGVIIGGGNLYENGELEVDLDALDALETPLMLFSLSRGRIYNRKYDLVARTDAMPDRTLRALHNKAKFALVRDQATSAYFQSMGCEAVPVGGCPTIFLDRLSSRLPVLAERYTETALIAIRNPSLMNIPLHRQARIYNDIVRMVDFLRSEGFRDIRLLCNDHRDIPFAASFADIEYVYTGDIYTYLALLKACALTISYRLHATLPCLSFGTSTIKISYDERALSLMKTIGLDKLQVNMFQSEDVMNEVIKRYRQLHEFNTLRANVQPTWAELDKRISETFSNFAADVRDYSRQLYRKEH